MRRKKEKFIFIFSLVGSLLIVSIAQAQSFSSFDKNCCIQRSNSSQCRVEDASAGGPCASSEYQRECSESAACAAAARDFDIEQQRKAEEAKKAAEEDATRKAAAAAPNNWTCVMQFATPPDPDKPDETEKCIDLKKVEIAVPKSEEAARAACYEECEQPYYGPYGPRGTEKPVRCYFIRTETCESYKQTPSGKFEGVPLEDELLRLRGQAGGLSQVGAISLGALIGRGIKSVMGIMGSIALIMFIYGGLMWMTARGNADKAGKALHTLLWGGLGVAVILSSYAVVSFVFEAFS